MNLQKAPCRLYFNQYIYGMNKTVQMVTLISDITMAMWRVSQRNGVLRRCAKEPCDVQTVVCAAEMSAPIIFWYKEIWGTVLLFLNT